MAREAALAASYRHCRRIARTAARNFYYGFVLLPERKRAALCALYAFMRRIDDLSDNPGALEEKVRGLAAWRAATEQALAGRPDDNPLWPALCHAVATYSIPSRYLYDVIAGAEMDLRIGSYETFDGLRNYCYHVAGAVGLVSVHVFGFEDERALEFAEKLGIAFQLTNILRDLGRDFAMGRVYLPGEDFARFGCRAEDLARPESLLHEEAFLRLASFEAERAWEFYREGWQLIPLVSPDSRPALWALARIYSGILAEIESRSFDVFSARVSLSAWEKAGILVRAWLGRQSENYAFTKRPRDRRGLGGAVLGRRAG
jgi:15-cis-phytoene synthase